MKLDKDTYLMAQDLFIRLVTVPSFKGNHAQIAVDCIKQADSFFNQWRAMEDQLRMAAAQAMVDVKPTEPKPEPKPTIQPLPRKGNGEREKLQKTPAKPLRAKARAKRTKTPVKPLRVKAKKKAKR